MKPFDLRRKIKLAKARKLYNKNHMTDEQLLRQSELSRKVEFIDRFKLAPLKDMLDALKLEDKTLAKVVIHCSGQQITLNPEQSKEVLMEAHRCLMIERQQLISEMQNT